MILSHAEWLLLQVVRASAPRDEHGEVRPHNGNGRDERQRPASRKPNAPVYVEPVSTPKEVG